MINYIYTKLRTFDLYFNLRKNIIIIKIKASQIFKLALINF